MLIPRLGFPPSTGTEIGGKGTTGETIDHLLLACFEVVYSFLNKIKITLFKP